MTDALSPEDRTPLLPGFEHGFADVNGTRLHYVAGGCGDPLFLLPGWPVTWWEFHKIMPALARNRRVVAVDIRGMGTSTKPASGYDKKTMARDILELSKALGHERIDIGGNDIGGMVAYSFAMNHPEHTRKLVLWETTHPSERLHEFAMVPRPGTDYYPWWIALNMVEGLPEKLSANGSRPLLDAMIDHLTPDPSLIDEQSRRVYAHAYDQPGALRAGGEWFRRWPQDIPDRATYTPFTGPVLVMGGGTFSLTENAIDDLATDILKVNFKGAGHFLAEERPDELAREIDVFLS